MRVLRSLTVLALLVPGLLAAPALSAPAGASPTPVAPVVQDVAVDGVDPQAAQSDTPSGVTGALVGGSDRRTVLLTDLLDVRPFSLVGVTWEADPAVGELESWVRTRTDGTWSAWQPLGGTGDEQPDAGTTDTAAASRSGTSPLWVGPSDGVQVRVDVLSGADPRGLRLSLVDPGESPADETVSASLTTSAAGTAPAIRSRADWGADESLRKGTPSYASSVRAVTIHHTASTNDYSAADVPRLLRGFYAYHVKGNGWSDLGYNFLVDRFGRIWEGRAGGVTRAVIGSHAGGFNTGTIGISMIGTYDAVAPSPEMREAVAQLIAWRLGLAGVDPQGTVRLTSGGSTRFPAGTAVTLPTVFGHKQVSTTACPGALGYAALPGLRERAAALKGGASAHTPAPSSLELAAPATAAKGSVVTLAVSGGQPGAPVTVWFKKRGRTGFTIRREGVLSDTGAYRTTYTADEDYAFFAMSGGRTTPRRLVRLTTAPTSAPVHSPTGLGIRGPVTVPAGGSALVTATGPAGAPVGVWFRREGAAEFVLRSSGTFGPSGTWTTTYTADVPHEYFALSGTTTSNDATTRVGAVRNGLDVSAPPSVWTGQTVDVVVQGTAAGQPVQVWFSRRGEGQFTRRRDGVTAADGTFRTSYLANDEYTVFATSGGRSSARVLTRVSALPPLMSAPAPKVAVTAPPAVDAGAGVAVVVTGTPGAEVDVWFRRRGVEVWSRLREGVFDAAGKWSTTYVGLDDHEYFATSGGLSSRDVTTLTTPVVSGPPSAPLGTRVELAGRARPGDEVVVEQRRRGAQAFTRTTVTADSAGVFRTSYAADDEYEYRALAASRVGALRRTTVAPTAQGASAARRGTPVTLSGTARPGALVEVLFRRDGDPTIAVGGRRSRPQLPNFRVGRRVTAGSDGRWSTTFVPTSRYSWYARSDGNASGVRTLAIG